MLSMISMTSRCADPTYTNPVVQMSPLFFFTKLDTKLFPLSSRQDNMNETASFNAFWSRDSTLGVGLEARKVHINSRPTFHHFIFRRISGQGSFELSQTRRKSEESERLHPPIPDWTKTFRLFWGNSNLLLKENKIQYFDEE